MTLFLKIAEFKLRKQSLKSGDATVIPDVVRMLPKVYTGGLPDDITTRQKSHHLRE